MRCNIWLCDRFVVQGTYYCEYHTPVENRQYQNGEKFAKKDKEK